MALITMLLALSVTSALSCGRRTVQAARGWYQRRRMQRALPSASVVRSGKTRGTVVLLLFLVVLSGCSQSIPAPCKGTGPDTSKPQDGSQRIYTPDGFVVQLLVTTRYVTITDITDSTGRVIRFEYDSNGQPTQIQLFDYSILEKREDGSWYHYSPPGWWARALPYTVERNDEGAVRITTPSAIVTYSIGGIRVTSRTQ